MNEQPNVAMGRTMLKRLELYKDRWTSFGANTGIMEISEKPTPAALKKFEIFQEYDDKFLEKISPDISIAKWEKDTILFEEGSYIDIAFYVVEGTVDVYLQKQQTADANKPIFDVSRTVVLNVADDSGKRLAINAGAQTVFQSQVMKQPSSRTEITFLSAMDFNLPVGAVISLSKGEFFGEIGALSGWPQSVTARTKTECTLVQIRVNALRLMRKSKTLKARLDKLYRERSLFAQLKATPLFRGCDDTFIQALTEKVELISCEPDEVLTKEGDLADAFFMVRSGFVKLSQRVGEGQIVVSYLSKGMTLGEAELLIEGTKGWIYTASSKEYSELVKISRKDFNEIVKKFPSIEKLLWQTAVARLKESGYSKKNIQQSEFINTALEKGLVEGNSILVIDLNTCTRCDDCVRGCASTHGGIPRFVREGEKYKNFLITRACYHCEDPVCLVGCPTGAIRRAAVGDVVEIIDSLCIGCKSCANNCPYDAITMYETGETWPDNMIPEGLRGKERLLATKCDLCYKSDEGPACVNSCPHSCAIRIGDVEEFKALMVRE
ncbi:MAG: cyclic nucleotide-binding domain-containing protein [Ignavibacteriae bacterium]|nr:cyclic nucleotide-binding domain-containing protein [Ignavibacteriota bacterium]